MHKTVVATVGLAMLGLTGCDGPLEQSAKPEALVQQTEADEIPVSPYLWYERIEGERLAGWIEAETRRP